MNTDGPLRGLRVLDFTRVLSGPFTKAAQGAEQLVAAIDKRTITLARSVALRRQR